MNKQVAISIATFFSAVTSCLVIALAIYVLVVEESKWWIIVPSTFVLVVAVLDATASIGIHVVTFVKAPPRAYIQGMVILMLVSIVLTSLVLSWIVLQEANVFHDVNPQETLVTSRLAFSLLISTFFSLVTIIVILVVGLPEDLGEKEDMLSEQQRLFGRVLPGGYGNRHVRQTER